MSRSDERYLLFNIYLFWRHEIISIQYTSFSNALANSLTYFRMLLFVYFKYVYIYLFQNLSNAIAFQDIFQ